MIVELQMLSYRMDIDHFGYDVPIDAFRNLILLTYQSCKNA